jgi:hypothetical protein
VRRRTLDANDAPVDEDDRAYLVGHALKLRDELIQFLRESPKEVLNMGTVIDSESLVERADRRPKFPEITFPPNCQRRLSQAERQDLQFVFAVWDHPTLRFFNARRGVKGPCRSGFHDRNVWHRVILSRMSDNVPRAPWYDQHTV